MSTLKTLAQEAWQEGLRSWNTPAIPSPILVSTAKDFRDLGAVGGALEGQFALMRYPEFQTYLNLPKITENFSDPVRAVRAISKHEIGHRFHPYDNITSLLLTVTAQKALKAAKNPNAQELAPKAVDLFCDTGINTRVVRNGDIDVPWSYQELSLDKERQKSPLWHVYMHSKELLWQQALLPKSVKLTDEERQAAEQLAGLFRDINTMDKSLWDVSIRHYATIISPYLTNEPEASNSGFGNTASANTPTSSEAMGGELVRQLARQGNDGLPTNPNAVKEYTDLMAGLGLGDTVTASSSFYEQLASRYSVRFATKPFGSPRSTPFQLRRWAPSDPIGQLDVQQSILGSGLLVPGLTTKKWHSRTTTIKGGQEEIVPTLDLLIDSSGSMPNPVETVSLPVLAGFVAARRAGRQGVRAINYWSKTLTSERTNDLPTIYKTLIAYHPGGGTVFPVTEFLANPEDDPRLSLVITDTFLANTEEAVAGIKKFRARHSQNRVTIYAITELPNAAVLVQAGAECIHGTTPNIFRHVLGKTEKVYLT